MADEKPSGSGFTIYLEGHEGHQGNVLAHAFLSKIYRLIVVLNKLERTFVDSDKRQTDFEITDADKVNPTTITLKPVPRIKAYDPAPAFVWSMEQIRKVSDGLPPDERVRSNIANDLVELATQRNEYEYKKFWINGYTKAVEFDAKFLENAQRLAREKTILEHPTKWHTGVSFGSITGELKAIDDIEGDRQFIIIPPSGSEQITCVFPDHLRGEMGNLVFKMVTVSGLLHYSDISPFPQRVDAQAIEPLLQQAQRKTLSELRGIFSGAARNSVNWDDLINV